MGTDAWKTHQINNLEIERTYKPGYIYYLHVLFFKKYIVIRKTYDHAILMLSLDINRLFAYCKGATLIFIYWRGLAISSAKEGKSGFTYNLVKS